MKHAELTEKIIGSFYKVYTKLGHGFLEKIYENTMFLEIKALGLKVEKQKQIDVYYDGTLVGNYYADLVVENCILCELKANEILFIENELQLLNYLKATKLEVGLLLNFGRTPEIKRKIFDNDKKLWHTTRTTRLL